MHIRILTEKDWKIWKQLRLEALEDSPESFESSYEEEVSWHDLDFQNTLRKNDIFGVFVDDLLVSGAGFYSLDILKAKHRGVMWGMYTQPAYRGKGIGGALIETIKEHAKSRVTHLHLNCVATNLGAVALYEKQGFIIYGTIPCALEIGDLFFDEHIMVLDLTKESISEEYHAARQTRASAGIQETTRLF